MLFPQSGHNGSELTKEMFRWDQRLFTVLLRMPGITTTADTNITDTTYDHFSSLCEYTGGLYCIHIHVLMEFGLKFVLDQVPYSRLFFAGTNLCFRKTTDLIFAHMCT